MRRVPDTIGRIAVFIVISVGLACYYLWAVRATGSSFGWKYPELGGYYNYLGRGFAQGHLYLPLQPSRELLAQSDPWSPESSRLYGMHDMVLFNGHYYLYHGAGPALILFTPWRLITGYDLPENFAVFLLCFGGVLFSAGALLRILALANARPGPLLTAFMLLAVGLCQSVPFLLNRIHVYEIAIGGGYFCTSAGAFFLARGIQSDRHLYSLAVSGLMFGLAVACRPHLGLIGAMVLVALAARARRSGRINKSLTAFAIPIFLCGVGIAAYNYARFDNPFEFGLRYLLTGNAYQQQLHFSALNIVTGLYYMLIASPDYSAIFPWIRPVLQVPFDMDGYPFPPNYFLEPTVGALYLSPIIAAALLSSGGSRMAEVRTLLRILLVSSAAILLFIAAIGFTSHRYEVDFLPLAVLAAVAVWGIQITSRTGITRTLLIALFSILTIYSITANLALGITGPYDDLLRNRPAGYVRIAGWFSPIERLRPMLDPKITIDLTVQFKQQHEEFREPLITMGQYAHRHIIYAEHHAAGVDLVSHTEPSAASNAKLTYRMAWPREKPVGLRVTYDPASRKVLTMINGEPVIEQQVQHVVTAPAQLRIGENRVDLGLMDKQFTGHIAVLQKSAISGSAR
jgi:hypothetical protein